MIGAEVTVRSVAAIATGHRQCEMAFTTNQTVDGWHGRCGDDEYQARPDIRRCFTAIDGAAGILEQPLQVRL